MSQNVRAVIDIGTNSAILLIADVNKLSAPLYEETVITRLGEGLGRTGRFLPEALQRNLDCLKHYKSKCDEFAVNEIRAVSTSAARDALNTAEFLAVVKRETNIDIKVLSGEQEASYSFFGGIPEGVNKENLAMIDIGGGSTEIVSLGENGNLNKVSLQLGGVRCLERFLHSDPPTKTEIQKLEDEILSQLESLQFNIESKTFFGVGGTFTALARVKKKLSCFDKTAIHNSILSFNEIKNLREQFASCSLSERKKIPGMEEKRADILLAGTTILYKVLEHFSAMNLIVSANGLRYGVFEDAEYYN